MEYLLVGYDSEGNVVATEFFERGDDDGAKMWADFQVSLEPEFRDSASVRLFNLVDLGTEWIGISKDPAGRA